MTTSVLEQPTLVLNQQWRPVHVTTVARSLILLWNDAARVVDPDEYRLFSWNDWAERQPADGAALHPIGPAAAARPRGHHPVALRPAAEHGGDVQPPQRRQARPLHLPVLRRYSPGPSRSPSTTSCLGRKVERRPGPIAWPPASDATPRRATALPSRRACGYAAGRFAPSGSRSTPRKVPGSKAGPGFWPVSRRWPWHEPAPEQGGRMNDRFFLSFFSTSSFVLSFVGVCSWESSEPPKLADRVRILAPLLTFVLALGV